MRYEKNETIKILIISLPKGIRKFSIVLNLIKNSLDRVVENIFIYLPI